MDKEYVFSNTKEWADCIVNNFGCNDLQLQCIYMNGDDVIASKRISYWHIAQLPYDEPSGVWNFTIGELVSKANNCSGIDILIPLDFDNGTYEEYLGLIKTLDFEGFKFIAYAANNRCRHIHIFYPKLRMFSPNVRKSFKQFLIQKYGCDKLKASDLQNIPICYPSPPGKEPLHWKTQLPIKVVFSNV